ncbi:hypothetical protein [Bittarella massiliensis (ex Durand et al. 2017)]|uniref:hypothetical protein n=1 Tax=Bittarella massiliensis (ex Durand et al. 2017) TaxID=1720313 RepID=UPI001AA191DE|nr:hypothetical protein [Bittarella massiliensis (ex Durand et al. 2017)]MBO1678966.1 hypothetical protein [Bittarella massiliensis (ex Durand et al. 2017)]
MALTNQLQKIQKKKIADQAQEHQYQQALLYINNGENLNLTKFSDDFIRRIIEQVTVLSTTQIKMRFVGGYEQDANPTTEKIDYLQKSTDAFGLRTLVLLWITFNIEMLYREKSLSKLQCFCYDKNK